MGFNCLWLQILDNAEINNLIKILGLQYNKKYSSEDDLKSLRYGHVMIMTDQDQDGSHIKGLLINFIHSNWPQLTRLPFLEEFITPIVKVSVDFPLHPIMVTILRQWKVIKKQWSWMKLFYNVIDPTASMFTAKMTQGSPEASATPWIISRGKYWICQVFASQLFVEWKKKNSYIK